MHRSIRWRCAIVLLVLGAMCGTLRAAEEKAESEQATKDSSSANDSVDANIAGVYAKIRPSLAVITVAGRDGRQRGLGTGFVVSADGLIATNMHVIGEGRPISVQLADGKRYEVTSVHASDWKLDLAVIRIDAQNLPPILLANSDDLRQGQAVAALGNPLGLKHSVVSGVVSGRREIDGRSMIQLAIPLEQGNSGGPLVDLAGRACGVLTLKSAVTANLGFAAAINDLKPLLDKPNPVPIDRWVRHSELEASSWQAIGGADWRSRGARIVVDGAGDGFGGRSLCLAAGDTPELPYELAASVKLDDESGAAGLAFAADGGDRHYGFYPSGGDLRLTRFDGPDVTNWTILAQQNNPHYRPGEWNRLHVRVEAARVTCSVNGHVAITMPIASAPSGRVGLAKFRNTRAEFKNVHLGQQSQATVVSPEMAADIDRLIEQFKSAPAASAASARVAADSSLTPAALVDRAEELTRLATQLRRASESLRQSRAEAELGKLLSLPEDDVNLAAALLWIARLDNDDIDVDVYLRQLDRLAADVAANAPADADEAARLAALNKFFFEVSGFHGSRGDYYHRANSYLNDVLDDREGLPITLSVVYMELARRLKLSVEGVGLPGHFVVRYRPASGESQIIDVYDGGKVVDRAEAERRVEEATEQPAREEYFQATAKRAIVVRVLHNLFGLAQREGDLRSMLRYLDAILTASPAEHSDRFLRAMLRWQAGDRDGAKTDVDWLLDHDAGGPQMDRVRELRAALEEAGR